MPRLSAQIGPTGAHRPVRMSVFELGWNRTGMSRRPRLASYHGNRCLLAGSGSMDSARWIVGITVLREDRNRGIRM